MELRRLGYFVCIAEQGSLCRAAEVLRIAQPALTRQVRLLEQELGVTLFVRTRRGMRLTEEGEHLRAEVVGPLRQLDLALQDIRVTNVGLSGKIALGMTPTVAYFLAQPLLERMANDAPGVAVRVVEGSTQHLNEWLAAGELDVAVLYGPSREAGPQARELLVEDMVLVGGAHNPLGTSRTIGFEELTSVPLILPNPKNGIRRVSERYASRFKVRFDIRYVIDSFQVIKDMVIKGYGFTILPMSAFLKELEDGTMRCYPMENPSRRTLVSAVTPHARTPRVLKKLDEAIDDVLVDLHARRRVFGELRISDRRASPPRLAA